MKVRDIIDGIIQKTGVPRIPDEQTCDHLMAGSLDSEVTKIGCTFMATVDVIREAAAQGINLIITHEPTWFTGKDDTEWLTGDPVYLEKKRLIEETHMNIWRFHDHMHRDREDGIFRGFDEEAGWRPYRLLADGSVSFFRKNVDYDLCYQLPKTTLHGLAEFFKQKFGMPHIRIVGDPDMPVERVALMPGGGSLGLGNEHMPMDYMRARDIDVILCGEVTEWTLPAYVRDAAQMGMNKGLLILGHERSEGPGMKHLGAWLKSIAGEIPVVFLDAGEPFTTL